MTPPIYPGTDLGFAAPPWSIYESGSGNATLADNANASGTTGSDNGYQARLTRIAAMGFKWVRFDMCLDVSSRVNEMDHMVNDAIAKGLKVIALAVEGPGGSHAFSGGIANWVNLVLNRYGTKISAIEFGNELNAGNKSPNYCGVAGDPTPEAFAPIMQQAYNACRANTTNPNAVVLVGSCTVHSTDDTTKTGTYGIRPDTWWQRFIAAAQSYKVGGQFPWDAAAFHPYVNIDTASTDPSTDTFTGGTPGVKAIHNIMAGAGDPGRMWVTEFGYYAADSGGTPNPGLANIPTWFTHMIGDWRNLSYAGPFMVYAFDGPNLSNQEGKAGAINPNDGTAISTVGTRSWYSTLVSLATSDNVPPIGDSTHPYPYVIQPAVGQAITIGTLYRLEGLASDSGSGVNGATAQFQIWGPPASGPWPGLMNPTALHSLVYYYDLDTTGFPPGTYHVRFVAADNAGNTAQPSGTGTVANDDIAFTLTGTNTFTTSVTAPAGGSTQGTQSGTHTSVVSLAATATATQFGVSSGNFTITGNPNPIIATPASANVLYTNNFSSAVTFSSGYLTSDGRDDSPVQDYTQTVTGGVFRVSNPAGNTDGNIRKVYWPTGMTPVADSEVFSTWQAQSATMVGSSSFQQGNAHRIVGSGSNIQAVTVTKNVIFGAYWIFNCHVWDSSQPSGSQLTQIGEGLDLGAHFNPSNLPWLIRSRVYGNILQFKVWLSTDTEPAWGDPNFGTTVTIPSSHVQQGVSGIYAGHIPGGGSMDYDNLTISDVSSWTASYDTANQLADGPHTITFTATNGVGATLTSSAVNFTLNNGPGGGGGGPVVQGTPLVQIAFGVGVSGTPATTDWVDVSRYVRSFSFKSPSRNRDLDLFQPGSAQITFDNRDRRFDPTYTSSPYSPNVLPLARVRIGYKDTNSNVTVLFTGLVEGWPQTYVENRDATVTVNCVDGFNLLSRGRPLSSPWKMAVDVDQPDHWWRLDDPVGAVGCRDYVAGADGTHVGGVTTQQDPIIAHDSGGKCSLYSTGATYTTLPSSAAPTGTVWTYEAWINVDPPKSGQSDGLATSIENVAFCVWYLGNTAGTDFVRLDVANEGFLAAEFSDGTTSWALDTTVSLGRPHHVVVTRSNNAFVLYVDGVAISLASINATHVTPTNVHRIHADPAMPVNPGFAPGLVSDVLVYDGVSLIAAQVAGHYQAGMTGWDGDQAGVRVHRILDWLGWPSALRNVDTGLSQFGPATWDEGADPLNVLQTITATCYAAMYIDPAGNLRWRDRVTLLTGARSMQSQTTFADARAFNIPYQSIEPGEDWQEIYNQVDVTRVGGTTQTATDDSSLASYGRLVLQLNDLLQRTDNEAADLANYLVSRRNDPRLRVDNITVNRGTSATFPSVLALALEDRVTVNRTPQKITPALTQQCWIEGFAHTFDASEPNAWTIQLTLGDAAPAVSYFILDRSTLNGPDILAF